MRSAVALNARLRGGMAGERRLGAGNGQGAGGPEADREHAVEDLCAACARAGLPARLTVHPHAIVGVFTGGHRGTFRDGRVSRPGNLGGHETWEDAGLPPPKRPGTTSTETKICSQLAC